MGELLEITSREITALAFGWHLLILLVALAMLRGWRPRAALGTWILILPAVSVFVVSTIHAQWFSAASFFLLALTIVAFTRDLDTRWTVAPSRWTLLLGCALVVVGFLSTMAGVAPGPTLALMAGFTLITGGHGLRSIPVVLAVWATFYAVFGTVALHVPVDLGLVAAVLALGALFGYETHERTRDSAHKLHFQR